MSSFYAVHSSFLNGDALKTFFWGNSYRFPLDNAIAYAEKRSEMFPTCTYWVTNDRGVEVFRIEGKV